MALDAFSNALGTRQGRIAPTGFTPTGSYAFCLGSDDEGRYGKLEVGDYAEVWQSIDVTWVNFIRARFRLRTPASLPANRNWEVSIRVGIVPYATFSHLPGQTRDRVDIAANVSKLAGIQTVTFRVTLVAV